MAGIKVHYFTNFINRRRNRYPVAQIGILWVKAGNLSYRLEDGGQGTISAGQYCFYNSAKLSNLETHDDNELFDALAIIVEPDTLKRFLQQVSNEPKSNQSDYPIAQCSEFSLNLLSLILNNLEKSDVSMDSLEHLAIALLADLCKAAPQTITQIKQSLTLSVSQKVIQYIEANIEEPISLEQTSASLGMSSATLKRRLSGDGVCFSNLVKIKRVNFAATLLRTTQESITQVGLASGYKSAAHFSTAFKEIQGITPKQFRANLRKSR